MCRETVGVLRVWVLLGTLVVLLLGFSSCEGYEAIFGDKTGVLEDVVVDDVVEGVEGTDVALRIAFDADSAIGVAPGSEVRVAYLVTGAACETGAANGRPLVKAVGQGGWRARVEVLTDTTGWIVVTAPDPYVKEDVLVFVYDGAACTIMACLDFECGTVRLIEHVYEMPLAGGECSVELETNVDFSVVIPEQARGWLAEKETMLRTMQSGVLTLTVGENDGYPRRTQVDLVSNTGVLLQTLYVRQQGAALRVHVEQAGSLAGLVEDAAVRNATDVVLSGHLDAADFVFLQSFEVVNRLDLSAISNSELPDRLFSNMFQRDVLEEVVLPDGLTLIPISLFRDCRGLSKMVMPEGVTDVAAWAFEGCESLTSMDVPASVMKVGSEAFKGCSALSELRLNEGLKALSGAAFEGTRLATVVIPNSVTVIGARTFYGNPLVSVTLGEMLYKIGSEAFVTDGETLNVVYCLATKPPIVTEGVFGEKRLLYVPAGKRTTYLSASVWKDFQSVMELD